MSSRGKRSGRAAAILRGLVVVALLVLADTTVAYWLDSYQSSRPPWIRHFGISEEYRDTVIQRQDFAEVQSYRGRLKVLKGRWVSPEAEDPNIDVSLGGFGWKEQKQRVRSNTFYMVRTLTLPYWAFVVILLLYPAVRLVTVLRRRRFAAHHCQSCGYNLTGNVSGVCSECGTPTDGRDDSRGRDAG